MASARGPSPAPVEAAASSAHTEAALPRRLSRWPSPGARRGNPPQADPLGPPETIDYKRYTSAKPDISWTQSFVPVYRELEQEDAPKEEPSLRRRKNPVTNFLEGWTPFKRARSPTRTHRGETWTPEMTSDEESALRGPGRKATA